MTETVLVVGPALAGATSLAEALRGRLAGCRVVEPSGLRAGPDPDAVVFAVSAAAPMTGSDAALLDRFTARTDAVVAAVTKIDVHRTWSDVLAANRAALGRHSARHRSTEWLGVAAAPEVGPPAVEHLAGAVRAVLADEGRRRRNRLRSADSALRNRIAEAERASARREQARVQAARITTLRNQVRAARVQLAGRAWTQCAVLRDELQQAAAVATRRELGEFPDRVGRRAALAVAEYDAAVAEHLARLATGAGLDPIECADGAPAAPLPPQRQPPKLENRLSAVFGGGFGLGVAVTAGRLLCDLHPAGAPALMPGCGVLGVALACWVVRTRRLLAARTAAERWAAEVAAGLRVVLERRWVAAESVLMGALPAGVGGRSRAEAPGLPDLTRALAEVRAELGDHREPTAGN